MRRFFWAMAAVTITAATTSAQGVVFEEAPSDPKAAKVVLVAGPASAKAGEHEYVAGCWILAKLLRQTPGVFPTIVKDGWPTKADTLADARAIVMFHDGGDSHALLKGDRLAQMQKLAEKGVGVVAFHQTIDFPKDPGVRAREWSGAVWEKGHSQRAHWVAKFDAFPDHPIFRGVTPFAIDDGWLTKFRFADKKGVTPLLRTASPKGPADAKEKDDAIVSWAFERPGGGRTFVFTGCHMHSSLGLEGYRRFLVNGILWSAGIDVPTGGASVTLDAADLKLNLETRTAKKK